MKRPAVSLTRRTAYVTLCPVGFVVLYSQKATRDLLGAWLIGLQIPACLLHMTTRHQTPVLLRTAEVCLTESYLNQFSIRLLT